jgi:hypothetical protein
MRSDARNLLERLGKQEFAYKEFTDRFRDLELWPAFEALLEDRRLFADAAEHVEHDRARSAPVPVSAPVPQPSAGRADLFARYDASTDDAPADEKPQASHDVRSLLKRLNEITQEGEA